MNLKQRRALMRTLGRAVWAAAFFMTAWAYSQPGWAGQYRTVPSTPDISVGSTATVEVAIPGTRADWVSLKNDCGDDVYFDLRGARDGSGNTYPLRLGFGESFTGAFTLAGAIEASASSGAAGSCTFTVMFGRE